MPQLHTMRRRFHPNALPYPCPCHAMRYCSFLPCCAVVLVPLYSSWTCACLNRVTVFTSPDHGWFGVSIISILVDWRAGGLRQRQRQRQGRFGFGFGLGFGGGSVSWGWSGFGDGGFGGFVIIGVCGAQGRSRCYGRCRTAGGDFLGRHRVRVTLDVRLDCLFRARC